MKKSYLKPESTRVELVISNFMLDDSNKIPVDGDGNNKVPSSAGEGRGQWGDVWK